MSVPMGVCTVQDTAHRWARSHQRENLLRSTELEIGRDVTVEIPDDRTVCLNDVSHLLRMSGVLQEHGRCSTKPANVE